MTPLRGCIRLSPTLLSALLLALLVGFPAGAAERAGFKARRGMNISHWLSQSRNRGDQRRAWFTREDVAFLAGLGLDHLRSSRIEDGLLINFGAPKLQIRKYILNDAFRAEPQPQEL